jgi:hypothetical protein
MNEREKFFARWSRRKQAAAEEVERETIAGAPLATPTPIPSPQGGEETRAARSLPQTGSVNPEGATSGKPGGSEHLFDLTKLPAIESITAETDISGFLAPGVPAELTRAALRRAFSADPSIREFIGPSESSWDFNAPDAMGGFGPLEMTEELRRQILQMVGRGLDAPHTADPPEQTTSQAPIERPEVQSMGPSTQEAQKTTQVSQPLMEPPSETDSCAQQDNEDPARRVVKRSHGGALPR